MRRWDLALVAWIAALAVVFVRAGWRHGPGVPLDDPYIYLDYARSAAGGHWLQYNPGDPPTSAATSLLWLGLLTLGRWVGVRGAGMLWWALGVALVCALAAAWLCRRAASALGAADWQAAALAGAVCATGAVAISLWGGLEVPLVLVAVCAGAEAWLAGAERRALAVACLLPLARPDVALAVAVVAPLLRRPYGLLPGIALGGYALAMWRWTGTPVMAGGSAKLLALTPGLALGHTLAQALVGAAAAVVDPWGWAGPGHGPLLPELLPGAVLLAWAALARRGRALALVAGAGLALEGAAFGPQAVFYQFGRYLVPYLPLLLLAAWDGAGRLRRPLPVAALGLALLGLPGAVTTFHRASGEISGQQVAIGRWVRRVLPRRAVLVVNDAGAMAYYGHRYTIDAVGIATRGFAAAARTPGQPGELAALARFLAARGLQGRPLYAAIYPDWLPAIAAAGVPVRRFQLPGRTIIDERTVVLYRLTDPPRTGGSPPAGA